jgi:endonuclease YncB( thermonuclease family)
MVESLIVIALIAAVVLLTRRRRTPVRDVTAHAPEPEPISPWSHPAQSPEPPPPPAAPTLRTLRGSCHVIDGDTIVIGRTKIRLAGIDAPELDQPYGQKAKWAMVGLCKGHVITAELTGETSHDRLVGTCYLPDGRDIGAELIKQGLALDWALFTKGKYRELEPPGIRRRLRAVAHFAKMEKARRAGDDQNQRS